MFLYPTPDLPDDTPIDHVRFFTRVRNALTTAGVKTVGEIREASDAKLLSLQDLGKGSVTIFGSRWAFPQPMGSGPWAKSPPDLLNFNEEILPQWGKTGCARLQVAERFGIGVPMTSDSVPTVGQLLVAAFGFSRAKNSQLNQRWIGMSWRIGSQLPQSLLSISIQRLGEVDLVCRALETELMTQPQQAGDLDLRPNYLAVLSEWWIGSAYAICYTLKDRKILSDAEFLRLADELRMIRVQVEKYEVPSDRGLSEPLQFSPARLRPDEKEAPIYTYDKNDRLKSHIPRKGVSQRWSYMWEVFDVKADATRWYERLDLSDRMLNLLAPVAEVAPDTAAASSSAVPE